jgi:hypothetical protein
MITGAVMRKGTPRTNSGRARQVESRHPFLSVVYDIALFSRDGCVTQVLSRGDTTSVLPLCHVLCRTAGCLRFLLRINYKSNTGMEVVLVGGPYHKFRYVLRIAAIHRCKLYKFNSGLPILHGKN